MAGTRPSCCPWLRCALHAWRPMLTGVLPARDLVCPMSWEAHDARSDTAYMQGDTSNTRHVDVMHGWLEFESVCGRRALNSDQSSLAAARQAQFIRLETTTAPFDSFKPHSKQQQDRAKTLNGLVDFITNVWHVPLPSVIFSITGGGASLPPPAACAPARSPAPCALETISSIDQPGFLADHVARAA